LSPYISLSAGDWSKTINIHHLPDEVWELIAPLIKEAAPETWTDETIKRYREPKVSGATTLQPPQQAK